MYKILRLNEIAPRGREILEARGLRLVQKCAAPDAILVRSHKISEAELPESVRALARAGAGVNNIPVEACTRRGIPVFNTPGANANSVKEIVIAALLLCSRGILPGIRYVENLGTEWTDEELNSKLEAEKKQFKGVDLAGRTLGVVGLGAVGARVAKAGLTLGMRVIGYDPALSVDAAWRLPGEVERREQLHYLVRDADYISVHVPVLESTRALFNKKLLSECRKGASLLNFSRVEVVDVAAIKEALDSGRLSYYVTDFPHPLLLRHKSAILMPHIGASTVEAEENCAVMAVEQLYDFLCSGNISNSVNFPSISLERRGEHRVAVCNLNLPKQLNAILSVLGEQNLNVVDMLNRSRGDIAYNLIDLEQQPGTRLLQQIKGLEGVINVRTIPPPPG